MRFAVEGVEKDSMGERMLGGMNKAAVFIHFHKHNCAGSAYGVPSTAIFFSQSSTRIRENTRNIVLYLAISSWLSTAVIEQTLLNVVIHYEILSQLFLKFSLWSFLLRLATSP